LPPRSPSLFLNHSWGVEDGATLSVEISNCFEGINGGDYIFFYSSDSIRSQLVIPLFLMLIGLRETKA
jgi:hypothetical protein